MHQSVIVSPPPPYFCYVGVFLLATTARKGVSTKRERDSFDQAPKTYAV